MNEARRLAIVLSILMALMIFISCNNQNSDVDHFQEGIELYHQGLFDEAIVELDLSLIHI